MAAIMKHDMKAILGEDFFKEEVRCDYLVSAQMKRIWAVLIDMYLSFAEVCDKHGIKYFVLGGTMLGAARHNGFIPWDDDLDVGMLRTDYEKFLSIAPKEFEEPLFFQSPYTDPDYMVSWVKIRNSSTTATSKVTSHRKFNQGLFIDVFPMDYCIPERAQQDTDLIIEGLNCLGAYMRKGSKILNARQKTIEDKYYKENALEEWEKIQRIASNPQLAGSNYMYCAVCTVDALSKRIWPSECLADTVDHSFEKIKVKLPIGYKTILSIQYGNYMNFPPVDERGIRHSDVTFDADRPYKEYLNK